MKAIVAAIALASLSGCADFERGFTESYNRARANDYTPAYVADATDYAPEPQAYCGYQPPIIIQPTVMQPVAPMPQWHQAPPLPQFHSGIAITPGEATTFYSWH
jgi:hypothetical protein